MFVRIIKVNPYAGAETKKGGGHVDTPYPSKQAGKTPANQSKQQTPKPAGSHPCKSCNRYTSLVECFIFSKVLELVQFLIPTFCLCINPCRSFNSENALDSHTKAKHTLGK